MDEKTEKPHYLEHRKRLRKRYIKNGIDSLQDYEIIELLLIYAIPRKDVKPIAKELIAKFKNLKNILNASYTDLKQIKGIGENAFTFIKFVKDLSFVYSKELQANISVKESDKDIIDYCIKKYGSLKDEIFALLYLNSSFNIILSNDTDEIISRGTVDRAAVYPRIIIEKALHKKACYLILVHNHPTQLLKPSKNDVNITELIELAAESVNIKIYDHIIVAETGHYSFRKNGLI